MYCLNSLLLRLCGLLCLGGGLLSGGLGLHAHVQVERGVLLADWSDEVLLVEVLDESSGDSASDLVLLTKNCSGDAKHLWDVLEHSLVLLLLEVDGVVKLFLDLDLGPALLLGLGTLSSLGSELLF